MNTSSTATSDTPISDTLSESRPDFHVTLRDRLLQLRHEKNLRQRDAAIVLQISEAEAVAAFVNADDSLSTQATLLRPHNGQGFTELLEQIPTLGHVMALTRNEAAVHEVDGCYENMSHQGPVGLALGQAIDLRIFYSRWRYGFAVTESNAKGRQHSLQFFDASGTALHKIYLREQSNLTAYQALVAQYRAPEQPAHIAIEPAPVSTIAPVTLDQALIESFRQQWRNMQDTHEFVTLLKNFNLHRIQALSLAGTELAYQVSNQSARDLLQQVAQDDIPIMVFVGNPGMIQIHSGAIKTVRIMNNWLNILDPGFNLHLREDLIAQSWVVKKPTVDGVVTSLELFDDAGNTLVMFFGVRQPGEAELTRWRSSTARLIPLAS